MRVMLGIVFATVATVAAAQEIGGRYEVQGTNLNGSPYAGVAEITVTSENTCRIAWDTGSISSGICMRNDDTFVGRLCAWRQGGTGHLRDAGGRLDARRVDGRRHDRASAPRT